MSCVPGRSDPPGELHGRDSAALDLRANPFFSLLLKILLKINKF